MFPGMEVTSTFFDGVVGTYVPSLPEVLLSLGGLGLGFTLTVVGVRVLRFLPQDDVAMLKDAGYLHD
jgi:Ni/Fe-hydrogenase subunit HybB-like protein